MKALLPALLSISLLSPSLATAHDQGNQVHRETLLREAIKVLPGHLLTVVTVTLKPGAAVPDHLHEATVFAYVVSGAVESQLNDQPIRTWQAGESWIERPGDRHTLTRNPSTTDDATLLALFIAEWGARLTTSGKL